jgi:hypothetical protein
MQEFRTKIITLLAIFEREIPAIFMHAYPHTVIHMPAQIFRWGSARTIWCFFLERYTPPLTPNNTITYVPSVAGLTYTRFAEQNAFYSSRQLQDTPTILLSLATGVKINGKSWKIGTPCFFNNRKFGVVTKMIYWEDRFQTTLILELHQYQLRGDSLNHWVPARPDMPDIAIFWNQLTHRCKIYKGIRHGVPVQNVVQVSTTKPHMDGIDFDQHMR